MKKNVKEKADNPAFGRTGAKNPRYIMTLERIILGTLSLAYGGNTS
jgi:hypothetical protein